MSPLDTRGVWEERLWFTNQPLPRRRLTSEHPMYGLPRQYIADGQSLAPWSLFGLADPVPAEWLPLPEHHEAVYLSPPDRQIVRIALVDYEHGDVVAWRLTGMAKRWQPTKPTAAPEPDEPAPDPIDKPRRTRTRRRRPPTDAPRTPPSRKPST